MTGGHDSGPPDRGEAEAAPAARDRELARRKLRALAAGDFSLYVVEANGSLTPVRAPWASRDVRREALRAPEGRSAGRDRPQDRPPAEDGGRLR
jgi:hypothetical protein